MFALMYDFNIHLACLVQNINFVVQAFQIAFGLPRLFKFVNAGNFREHPTDMRQFI